MTLNREAVGPAGFTRHTKPGVLSVRTTKLRVKRERHPAGKVRVSYLPGFGPGGTTT